MSKIKAYHPANSALVTDMTPRLQISEEINILGPCYIAYKRIQVIKFRERFMEVINKNKF